MTEERARYEREVEVDEGYVGAIRCFESGATRDTDEGKLDFEGFLSPFALEAYAQYLHKHRRQRDGQLRASDNWQKGMPVDVCMKSLWRHFFAVWRGHRCGDVSVDDLCGVIFNAMALLHEMELEEKGLTRVPGDVVKYE